MKRITWLYIVAAFYWIGLYTYPAILPIYIQEIVHDLSLTGAILSMFGLLQIFIRLPLGIASDIFGNRKQFVLLGLIALGIGPLVLSQSTSSLGLFVGRAITGIAAGTWVPLSTLILNENPLQVYKTTSILSFISNFGSAIAVLAAPFLISTKLGVSALFIAASVSALFAFVLLVPFKDDKKEHRSNFLFKSLIREITNPLNVLPGLLCAIVLFGAFATTFTFIPLIGKGLQLTNNQLSSFMISYFIISMITNMWLNRISSARNRMPIAIIAFFILGFGVFLTGHSKSYLDLLIAQLAVGLAYGINFPLLLGFSMSNSKRNSRTITMGIFQSIYSIGMFAGPPVSTLIAEKFGISFMSVLVAVFISIVGPLLILLYNDLILKHAIKQKSDKQSLN
jgi:MFS family permease